MLGNKVTQKTKAFKSILLNGPKLFMRQQLDLVQPYKKEEDKRAIFSIDKNKSPRPDGYGSDFFKDAWEIIRTNITTAILNFFKTRSLLQQLNTMVISLIPKMEVPLNAG